MSELGAITSGFPLCQNSQGEQTNWSKGLRVTAIAFGVIGALVGALTLAGIPMLGQLGTVAGWAMLSVGAALALMGISIKCVRKEIERPPFRIPDWFPDPEIGIPTLHLPIPEETPYLEPIEFSTLKEALKGEHATYYSAGPDRAGLYLRLHVEHLNPDLSPSQTAPFSIDVIAWKKLHYPAMWRLNSAEKTVQHRGGDFCTRLVLKNGLFSTYEIEKTEGLVEVKNHEALESSQQFSLAWILLRLFNAEDFIIRELDDGPIDYSFETPAEGYWKISLDAS